jgi:hypothetical protein
MKFNADVKEVPWKKVAVVTAVVVLIAGVSFAAWKKSPGPANALGAPEDSKGILAKYLKEKSGKTDFTIPLDAAKEKNPWTVLRTAYDAPPDYKTVYTAIGQHLFVTDALLRDDDAKEQQKGLRLAAELCEVSREVAYDSWLGARICDAYLLPNIDLVEEKPRNGISREQFVQMIARIYKNADEPDRMIQLGKMLLANSGNGRRADGIRYRLARELEQRGEHKDAARYLREITDPSLTNEASRRLVIVERNLKQSKN